MQRIQVFGLSRIHKGALDKPNEDKWGYSLTSGVIAIADGITRSRLADGTYPAKNALVAPSAFVNTMLESLGTEQCSTTELESAVRTANQLIADENQQLGLTKQTVDYDSNDYLGTTGLVLRISDTSAAFAFIGDVIAIFLPQNGRPKLLTRDQLHACHRYSYATFTAQENAQRVHWQRSVARNRPNAHDSAGNKLGFGALTGEEDALHFLEGVDFQVARGDTFILASDALRAAAEIGEEEEAISSYAPILESIHKFPFAEWPKTLIDLTRRCEVSKKMRSDDATVVVVRIV